MCDTSEKICIGFIGLGLIGGSIAKTLRKVHPEYKLMAYCRTKATIEEAIQEGVIDIALEERDDRFADCDYIFLCAPVSTNISYLPFVKGIAKPGCIITDVGSVKGEIHQAVETLGMTHQFIGGHPMAGSEKTGYSSATDYLLENAYYMITPGPDVEIATVSAFVDLVQSLKAIPMVLTYEEHDYITAGVSHLPHIVAATLVKCTRIPGHTGRADENRCCRRLQGHHPHRFLLPGGMAADLSLKPEAALECAGFLYPPSRPGKIPG